MYVESIIFQEFHYGDGIKNMRHHSIMEKWKEVIKMIMKDFIVI